MHLHPMLYINEVIDANLHFSILEYFFPILLHLLPFKTRSHYVALASLQLIMRPDWSQIYRYLPAFASQKLRLEYIAIAGPFLLKVSDIMAFV